MVTPRSPFSILTLTYNRDTGHIEATAHNISRLEALKLAQKYAIMIIDGLIESAPPSAKDEPEGEPPNGCNR